MNGHGGGVGRQQAYRWIHAGHIGRILRSPGKATAGIEGVIVYPDAISIGYRPAVKAAFAHDVHALGRQHRAHLVQAVIRNPYFVGLWVDAHAYRVAQTAGKTRLPVRRH